MDAQPAAVALPAAAHPKVDNEKRKRKKKRATNERGRSALKSFVREFATGTKFTARALDVLMAVRDEVLDGFARDVLTVARDKTVTGRIVDKTASAVFGQELDGAFGVVG